MKMYTKLILVLSVSAILNGCSTVGIGQDDYSCKGYPEGVTCTSATKVYDLTNGDDYQEQIASHRVSVSDGEQGDDTESDSAHKSTKQTIRDATPNTVPHVVPRPAKGPIPIRTPAQVMRIWIAPWESERGDLHVPGYVYTEVEPRRWMIGFQQSKHAQRLTPLRQPNLPSGK